MPFLNVVFGHTFIRNTTEKTKIKNKQGKEVKGFRITIQSVFGFEKEKIWNEIQHTSSLMYVCKPLVSFTPLSNTQLKEKWEQGETAHLTLWIYGILPFGKHHIHLESIEPYRIQSREGGDFVQIWDHLITMETTAENQTLYTDQVDIYAGWLTTLVAWWSRNFYKHRQKRWQKLLKKKSY